MTNKDRQITHPHAHELIHPHQTKHKPTHQTKHEIEKRKESSLFKLSIKDLRLINELEGSFRPSISSIAKRIGVSKEVANYRLNRLTRSGFIKEYNAAINYRRLGHNLYRLVINLHDIKEGVKEKIIAEIKEEKKAKAEVFIQTNKDLEVFFFAKTNQELSEFYSKIVEKHSSYIQQKEVFIVTKRQRFTHAYLHGKKSMIAEEEESGLEDLDDADEKIIEALTAKPNAEVASIAQIIKIPLSTAIAKMRRLREKGIIESINPVLNTSMVGYSRYNIDILLKSLTKKHMIIELLTQSKNVTEIYEYIGRYDLGFEAHFQTTADLENFLDELRVSELGISDYDVTLMLN